MSDAPAPLAPGLEIAVVPDFCGEIPLVFEARTLFVLASWLELFGENPPPPPSRPRLHLCCIGEPPDPVRRLAARAGARLTVHAPVAGLWGGFANKLRGLENPSAARTLLLDADVLLLGPLDGLDALPGDFAAAAAGKPRVPLVFWERIYAALGLPLPTERIVSLRERLGLGLPSATHRYEGQRQEAASMLPYYNSGVLLARAGGGLRARWEDHLRRILALASAHPEMSTAQGVIYSDQAGLATALQSLRRAGRTFEVLPDIYNVRLAHLRAGSLRWSDLRLFHAAGFLRGLPARADLPAFVQNYAARWSEAIREGNSRNPALADDTAAPALFLENLWQRWVLPEWEQSGP